MPIDKIYVCDSDDYHPYGTKESRDADGWMFAYIPQDVGGSYYAVTESVPDFSGSIWCFCSSKCLANWLKEQYFPKKVEVVETK